MTYVMYMIRTSIYRGHIDLESGRRSAKKLRSLRCEPILMGTEVAEKRRRLTRDDGGQAYAPGGRGPEDPEEALLTAEQRQNLRLSLGKSAARGV